jgi:hypothetical protein
MSDLFGTPEENKGAKFDALRTRRYVLWRVWDESKPKLMFIGLNPSTANETTPDPTITKIKSYCKAWGYGGFYMLNLFTQVTPDPDQLTDPQTVSIADLSMISKYAKVVNGIVFCWGAFPHAVIRATKVIGMFPDALCLGHNTDGSPFHPMYKNPNLQLIRYAK